MPCPLYAVLVAHATNLGLSGMARASTFSNQQLEWAWEQYCREPTLTAASASLVDYHRALPLAPVGHAHINALGRHRFDNPDGRRPANSGPYMTATPTSSTAGRAHRSVSVATNTKRWKWRG